MRDPDSSLIYSVFMVVAKLLEMVISSSGSSKSNRSKLGIEGSEDWVFGGRGKRREVSWECSPVVIKVRRADLLNEGTFLSFLNRLNGLVSKYFLNYHLITLSYLGA